MDSNINSHHSRCIFRFSVLLTLAFFAQLCLNTPPLLVVCTFSCLFVSRPHEQQTGAASFALFGENMSVWTYWAFRRYRSGLRSLCGCFYNLSVCWTESDMSRIWPQLSFFVKFYFTAATIGILKWIFTSDDRVVLTITLLYLTLVSFSCLFWPHHRKLIVVSVSQLSFHVQLSLGQKQKRKSVTEYWLQMNVLLANISWMLKLVTSVFKPLIN